MSKKNIALDLNRFYKQDDAAELRFYQIQKALLTSARYRNLSDGAKILYAVLQDRQMLSQSNGDKFQDELGFYCVFPIDSYTDENGRYKIGLAETVNKHRSTVMGHKKELVQYGLIYDRRMGNQKANRMYVLKIEEEDSNQYYEKSSPVDIPKDISCVETVDNDEKTVESLDTPMKSDFPTSDLKSDFPTSIEVGFSDPNDTDLSDTLFFKQDDDSSSTCATGENSNDEQNRFGQTFKKLFTFMLERNGPVLDINDFTFLECCERLKISGDTAYSLYLRVSSHIDQVKWKVIREAFQDFEDYCSTGNFITSPAALFAKMFKEATERRDVCKPV